jgi:hypothetical protein
MDTSISNQSGGTAAATPNINSNQKPDSIITMNDTKHDTVALKQSAAKFACAASSLKNNIKSGKLPAIQSGENAPYMVRLADVERFLRDTPGIASIFHPAAKKSAGAMTGKTVASGGNEPAMPEMTSDSESPTTEKSVAQPIQTHPLVEAASAKPGNEAVEQSQSAHVPDPLPEPSTQPGGDGTKRRRRRRRGKGGGKNPAIPSLRQPVLKALAGTTPQERLRITACLNELAGLVASA